MSSPRSTAMLSSWVTTTNGRGVSLRGGQSEPVWTVSGPMPPCQCSSTVCGAPRYKPRMIEQFNSARLARCWPHLARLSGVSVLFARPRALCVWAPSLSTLFRHGRTLQEDPRCNRLACGSNGAPREGMFSSVCTIKCILGCRADLEALS
jgi:hypothetical protein